MLGASKTPIQQTIPYATGADFCRIFAKDMNRLYLLSFLLTGESSMAEKCFVSGLEDATKGNEVFKEWAESWARRTIIRNAIQMIHPRPTEEATAPGSEPDRNVRQAPTEAAEVAAILDLPLFERFAFVMSVLEGYPDRQCSLLLECTRADVAAARTRALQQLGELAEPGNQLASARSGKQVPPGEPASRLARETLTPLAISA